MNLTFANKKISGILTVVPRREMKFDDEIENYKFTAAQSVKLKMVMGYNTRRVVEGDTCVSDLCIHGLNFLFDSGLLRKEEIDALILVTQTPDYLMPATSAIIQGHFKLKQEMICMDINQGCAGFVVGLFQAFMLLDQPAIRKVVLLNADVLSRKTSAKDRNSNPLVGDAASVCILQRSDNEAIIHGNIKMDGTGAMALMIPAGGMRLPSSQETAILHEDAAGNLRALDNLVMKGDDVFNFVQREVPPMIDQLLETASRRKEDVDFFMFHQPNKFMLQKLADKMQVGREKMPNNIVENFGNSSGVSIPMAITHTLNQQLVHRDYLLCLAGFGVGLTWASLLLKTGPLSFCQMIEF